MNDNAELQGREKYRCPATHAVDGGTVRCIFAPHESSLLHMVRLSGSRRVVRWGADEQEHKMLGVIQAVALSLAAFAVLCVWADR